jgi:hypothetical protein
MVSIHVERWEHWGVIAALIKDGGLMPRLHARLVPDAPKPSHLAKPLRG